MQTPVVYSAVKFQPKDVSPLISQGPYDVYIGDLDGYKLPIYVVINRNTSVVEFTNEVLPIIDNWLSQAAPISQGFDPEVAKQLSFNLKN